MSFETLGLRAELLRAVENEGYTVPTPIQLQAIPIVLEGHDLLAGAQTGTGKTAAFTLPVLHRLADTPVPAAGKRPVRCLILTPTRELAAQVGESVATYGRHLSLRSTVVYGGVSINPQMLKLRAGVDVLVATPGRLLDLVNQNAVRLNQVETLVLDEADRMLDMGFIHDIRKVLALLPAKRQNLLFSATFSDEIRSLSGGILKNPKMVEVARRNTAAETVSQHVIYCDKARKRELLSYLIGSRNWSQVLVFARTKHGANRLAEQLATDGLRTAALHGNKSQGARTRALSDFKAGKVRVLVATDIAARGIDIDSLPYVVNFELPNISEDYVHRIGRTGRAMNVGEAWSLVCGEEKRFLKDIESLLKTTLPREKVAGFEPDPRAVHAPEEERPRRNTQQRRPSSPGKFTSQADQTPRRGSGAGRPGAGAGRGNPNGGARSNPNGGARPPRPQAAGAASGDREVNGNVAGRETHNGPRANQPQPQRRRTGPGGAPRRPDQQRAGGSGQGRNDGPSSRNRAARSR